MSCDVGHRPGSHSVLLWLWYRLVATAPIGPLAWEPPYAMGVVLKTFLKIEKIKNSTSITSHFFFCKNIKFYSLKNFAYTIQCNQLLSGYCWGFYWQPAACGSSRARNGTYTTTADLGHCSDNTVSLTHCATRELCYHVTLFIFLTSSCFPIT